MSNNNLGKMGECFEAVKIHLNYHWAVLFFSSTGNVYNIRKIIGRRKDCCNINFFPPYFDPRTASKQANKKHKQTVNAIIISGTCNDLTMLTRLSTVIFSNRIYNSVIVIKVCKAINAWNSVNASDLRSTQMTIIRE